MHRLISYLKENIVVDFQGDLTVETLKELLSEESAPEVTALLSKVVNDGLDDMMITLADCLTDTVRSKVDDTNIREQLQSYIEA